MATLADALRGYTPPTESALADPIKEHFRTLPQQLETNQRAMDKTMAGMYKTDFLGKPNPNYYPEAMGEFTQNYMPNVMGTTTAVRMAKAMKNAMLPVAEGGLGLPAGNTAMQRAEAMGYTTPAYHGTNADINAFNVAGKGKTAGAGAFVTTNPTVAETYTTGATTGSNIMPLLVKKEDLLNVNARNRNWADIYTNELSAKSGKTRYTPQELGLDRNSATTTDELGMIAGDMGKKGVEIKNVKDLGPNSHSYRAKEYLQNKYGIKLNENWDNVSSNAVDEAFKYVKKFYNSQKGDIIALQDPSLIRSRFAAFDPKRKNEADILAAGLAVPLTPVDEEKNRKELIQKQVDKLK